MKRVNTRARNKLFKRRLTVWLKSLDNLRSAENQFKKGSYGKSYIIKKNRKGEVAIFTKGDLCYLPPEIPTDNNKHFDEDEITWIYRGIIKGLLGKKTFSRFGW